MNYKNNPSVCLNLANLLKGHIGDFNQDRFDLIGLDLHPNWDSVFHLSFLVEIEKEYNLLLEPEKVEELITLEDIALWIIGENKSMNQKN